MPTIQIKETADGSHTFFVPELDEHYHSVNGALTESTHIFIENGLRQIPKQNISILEIGFGTGLNAILSCLEAKAKSVFIQYTTIELYPIEKEEIKKLNFPDKIDVNKLLFQQLHDCEWDKAVEIDPHFTLHKIKNDLTTMRFEQQFDLIYFDAFAPEKQPEMWSQDIFSHLFEQTNKNGILTTYCAKGVVRRMLQTAGFITERLPGPPGKREMLRARKG